MNIALALLLCLPAPVSTWRMKTTAYCPCAICCEGWSLHRRTSTGRDARLPGCAADPKVLPYGSILDIPGYGTVTVDDTGGAMRQAAKKHIIHIDFRMKTHKEAKAWGVRWLDVKVLKYGKAKK